MTILFRTRHGSHLYGLAHADSDEDWYTVIANPGSKRKSYAKHTIHDGLDSTVVSLSTFMVHCYNGVPQALEALFSQEPEVDLLTDFRRSYRIQTGEAVARYKRTIKSFSRGEKWKQRRHAVRLCLNLSDMLRAGRFNPTLTQYEIETCDAITNMKLDNYHRTIDRYLGSDE